MLHPDAAEPAPDGAADPVDVVTLGETMAAFVPVADGFDMIPVGAESNVAIGVAQLGCHARWISRLGCDDLGRRVLAYVAGHGVDARVEWDENRPTGVCVKELSVDGTRMRYYRSGSAASRLDERTVPRLAGAQWIHVSGVTPALSPSTRGLIEAVASGAVGGHGRTSFDVNYRPVLWASANDAARALVPLAQRSRLVFIGDDEARALLGTTDVDRLRDTLITADDHEVVLKRGAGHATLVTATDAVSEPAHAVEVVDLTGAGDAFAAGFLAATCWRGTSRGRLAAGHFLASRAVGVLSDCGPALRGSELERLKESVVFTPQDRNDAS